METIIAGVITGVATLVAAVLGLRAMSQSRKSQQIQQQIKLLRRHEQEVFTSLEEQLLERYGFKATFAGSRIEVLDLDAASVLVRVAERVTVVRDNFTLGHIPARRSGSGNLNRRISGIAA